MLTFGRHCTWENAFNSAGFLYVSNRQAALQAFSKGFHLAVLAGDGVIGVLEGAEQQRGVLAMTDEGVNPEGTTKGDLLCRDTISCQRQSLET